MILKVTTASICGSDLHFVHGIAPMEPGDTLGHEFCGIVEEVGSAVQKFKPGDHVVAHAGTFCGECPTCRENKLWACMNGGIYGNGHMFGNLQGAQAEYVRVLNADLGLRLIPDGMTDEQILFVGDILATAYTGLVGVKPGSRGLIVPGETVAVFGDGPVGLCTTAVAKVFGASQIILVGHHDNRLEKGLGLGATTVINAHNEKPVEIIMQLTGGRGVDLAIEAAGSAEAYYNCMQAICLGGIINVLGIIDEPVSIQYSQYIPKNATIMGGISNPLYTDELIELIRTGRIDMTSIITHTFPLAEAEKAYNLFENRLDGVIKVMLKP